MANNDNDVAQGKPTESLTVEASAATAKMEELKPCPMTWERAFKIVSSRLSMVCASGSGLKEFLDAGSLKEFTQAEVDQRPSPPAPDLSRNVQAVDVPTLVSTTYMVPSHEQLMELPPYGEREAEELGEFYIHHVSAMTKYALHDKNAIAAELAYRDWLLAAQAQQLNAMQAERDASDQRLSALGRENKRLADERDALANFKTFVHAYLDQHGVPQGDPDNQHQKEGCRIGARLDLVFAERDELRKQLKLAADKYQMTLRDAAALTEDNARLKAAERQGEAGEMADLNLQLQDEANHLSTTDEDVAGLAYRLNVPVYACFNPDGTYTVAKDIPTLQQLLSPAPAQTPRDERQG